MADEAFALSPISARSASPSDADYDAIREAFMETARGRWFLGEYARRNRSADTAMVLDAVARLEESLAARSAEATGAPPTDGGSTATSSPPRDELLASVNMILGRTRAAIAAALSAPSLEEALSPLRRGARIIQEIAWGLRESGSDGRICDILDKQVRAIAAACDVLAAAEPRDAVLHAFDASLVQLEKLTDLELAPVCDESAARDGSLDGGRTPAATPRDAPATTITDMDAAVIDADPAPPAPDTAKASATPEPAGDITPHDAAGSDSAAQSSLGASLMAHGIIAQAASSKHDPLAPIRRMSHAEKIAFFS